MRYKLLTLAIIACLIFCFTGLAFASSLVDTNNHWAKPQIEKWVGKGLASGYPDNTFRPDNTISRAEFVSLVNRAFGKQNSASTSTFKDVEASDWFYKEVAAAQAAGYISGYEDGTFRPNDPVTRQEAASIVFRLLKLEKTSAQVYFKDADSISQWARDAVYSVAAKKVMNGYPDATFRPFGMITRAETLVMLDNALALLPVEPEEKGITGHVYIDDKAVEGAVLKLFEKGKYTVIKETTTDSKGEYVFAVDAGAYDITAVKDNYVAYVGNLVVTDKLVKDITLAEGSVLKGNAVDNSSSAMKDTTLTFTTNPGFIIVTDKDGNFTITVLPAMIYTISAGSGYNPITGIDSGSTGVHLLGILRFGGSGGGGGGGGGSNSTTAAVKATAISATLSGYGAGGVSPKSGTLSSNGLSGTIDLSNTTEYPDSALITDVSITAPAGSTLTTTSVDSDKFATVPVSKTLSNIGSIGISQLLSINKTSISVGTLRAVFGSSVTVNGTLACTGYSSSAVSLEINLGTNPGIVPNDYVTIDTNGTTVTAKIKTGQGGTLLATIGITNFISNTIGELPASVSTDNSNFESVATVAGRNAIINNIVVLISMPGVNWNNATLADLSGKEIFFKKIGSSTVYTLKVIS